MEESNRLTSAASPQEIEEVVNLNIVCRVCGNQSGKLIGIFSEDCLSNDLPSKVNLYLPINVSQHDALPQQVCTSCATTVSAWHDFVMTCAEVNTNFQSYGGGTLISEEVMDASSISDGQYFSESELPNSQPINSVDKYKKTPSEFKLASVTDNIMKNQSKPMYVKQDFDIANIDDSILPTRDSISNSASSLREDFKKNNESDRISADLEGTSANFSSISEKNGCLQKEMISNEYKNGCLYCSNIFSTDFGIRSHLQERHPDIDFIKEANDFSEMVTLKKYSKFSEEILGEEVRRQLLREKIRKNNKIDLELVNKARLFLNDKVYYNCKDCGKSLHSPYTYVWHIRIHTGERPYICDLCGKQFRVSQGLVRHLKETHARIKKFSCDLCNRFFATKRNVKEHRRIHTNERPYVCDLCGKSFKQKASLFVHNRSHTNIFPYECSYCPSVFRTKPGERPYICDLCGKQFRVSQGLVRHLKETHARIKKFSCDLCNRFFATKRNVKEHRRIHTNERPYVCDLCGKSFKQKASLFVHNRSHTNIFPYECSYCPSVFGTKPLLNGHLTKHTGEKPYSCDLCGRQFRIKYELKRHKLIHSDTKPFLCTLCKANFRQKRYLRNHLKSNHQGYYLENTSEGTTVVTKTE